MELLGAYSKRGDAGISTISVTEQAVNCIKRQRERKIPSKDKTPKRERARILEADEIADLVKLYQAGDSTYTLAKKFGIHRGTVTAHLERAGIVRRLSASTSLDVATREHLIELAERGLSVYKNAP